MGAGNTTDLVQLHFALVASNLMEDECFVQTKGNTHQRCQWTIGRSGGARVCSNISKEVTLKTYVKRQSQQIELCSVSVCGGVWLGTTVTTEHHPPPHPILTGTSPLNDCVYIFFVCLCSHV